MAAKHSLSPGIMLVTSYLTLFAVNAIIIWLANRFFPHAVVLGTVHLSRTAALLLSMGVFTLLTTFFIPFVNQYETNRDQKLSNTDWMTIYFVINTVGLWLVARAADILGFGISSFWVAIALGAALDLVQSVAMMQLENVRTQAM